MFMMIVNGSKRIARFLGSVATIHTTRAHDGFVRFCAGEQARNGF